MLKEKAIEFYNSHRGGVNGAVIGFILAVTTLVIGFFRTLFIAIAVLIGYYIGKKVSEDKDFIKNFLDRVLPPGSYR